MSFFRKKWTLEKLQSALREEGHQVLRDDDNLCIKASGEPVAYIELNSTNTEAHLWLCTDTAPNVAALIAQGLIHYLPITVDMDYMFKAYRIDAVGEAN